VLGERDAEFTSIGPDERLSFLGGGGLRELLLALYLQGPDRPAC
jgi:hypothetical protein